jgi:branched-chain amino acid aminotransferase
MGYKVEERQLSIDEIMDAHKAGTLKEIFGTGTAATISLIKELCYKDYAMKFDVEKWAIAPEIKRRMDAIKYGQEPDVYEWMYKI